MTRDGFEQNVPKSHTLTLQYIPAKHNVPLLCPLVSLSTVHSSIVP